MRLPETFKKLIEAGEQKLNQGEYHKALKIFKELKESADSMDKEIIASCYLAISLLRSGNLSRAEKIYRRLVTTYSWERFDSLSIGRVYVGILQMYRDLFYFKLDSVLDVGNKMYQNIKHTDWHFELGRVLSLLGYASARKFRLKESIRYLEEAISSYKRAGAMNEVLEGKARLVNLYTKLGNLQKAKELIDELTGEGGGSSNFSPLLDISMGTVYLIRGEWNKALEHYTKSYNTLSPKDKNWIHAAFGLAYVYTTLRSYKIADGILDSLYKTIGSLTQVEVENALYCEYKAYLHYMKRDYKGALSVLGMGENLFNKINHLKDLVVEIKRLKAEILLKLGGVEEAQKAIKIATRVAEEIQFKYEMGICYRVYGEVEDALGNRVEAEKYFKKSVEVLDELGAKYELAKALLSAGLFYFRSKKDVRRALDSLLRAQSLFEATDELLLGWTKLELARVKLQIQDLDIALQLAYEANKIFKKFKDKEGQAEFKKFIKELEEEYKKAVIETSQGYKFIEKLKNIKNNHATYHFRKILSQVRAYRGFIAIKAEERYIPRILYRMNEDEAFIIKEKLKLDSDELSHVEISLEGGHVILPLRVGNGTIGIMYVKKKRGFFTSDEVSLLRMGADFLALKLMEEEAKRLEVENRDLRQLLKKQSAPVIITQSEKMLEVLELIDAVKDSDIPVLIEGETGTGKDLLAHYLHKIGNRKNKPFVVVNCAAIPDNLVESELFGYVRGAFTGANTDRDGKFKIADGGIIFLNEIGDLPLLAQAKLLRVLDYGEFEPVGSNRTIKVDVRVIAATNKDLKSMIDEGTFREDLYHRLATLRVELPPLRERREDIPLLVDHYVNEYKAISNKPIAGVTSEAMQFLIEYDWPGNVRELVNAIKRAVSLASPGEKLDVHHFQDIIRDGRSIKTWKEKVEQYEKELLRTYLELADWKIEEACKLAGLSRSTFYHLVHKYDLYLERR